MKCNKCGAELRIVKEEYCKDVNGNPMYKDFAYCDICKTKSPLNNNTFNTNSQNNIQQPHTQKTYLYDKLYLSSWVISICFAFSFLILPLFVGLVLLILQTIENSKLKKTFGYRDELDRSIQLKKGHLENINNEISNCKQQIANYELQITNLQNDVISADTLSIANSIDYSSIDSYSSEECKNQLSLLQQEEKELIKNRKATKSSSSSKKKSSDNAKQILRCFNAECDNIILSVSVKNIDTLRNKIVSSYESLNKIFAVDDMSLTKELLEYKLKELTLIHSYERKRAEEREIQKAKKSRC